MKRRMQHFLNMLPLDKIGLIIVLVLCASSELKAQFPENPNNPFSQLDDDKFKEAEKKSKEKKPKPVIIEPFCKNLAESATYWQISAENLQIYKNKGLGYTELVKVVLISKKSGKTVDDVIKKRNTEETFKKICQRYNVDYEQIKVETKKIMSEVKIYGKK